MELKTLKYFVMIVREQNISKAAERLYLTQPTLTKQMQELENELEAKLFERGKRKITLTEDGLFLYKKAQEIIDLETITKNSFQNKDKKINGEISIACGETYAMNYLLQIYKKIHEENPLITISLFSGNDEDVREKLNNGLAEFALFIGLTNLDNYNFIKLPLNETWGLLMNKNSQLAKKETIKSEDLSNLPLLVSRQVYRANELSGWLNKDLSKLNIIGTYNLLYNASLMVKEDSVYAITIDKLLKDDNKVVFKKFEPELTSNIYFAWKKYQVLSKAGQLFLDELNKKIENKNTNS